MGRKSWKLRFIDQCGVRHVSLISPCLLMFIQPYWRAEGHMVLIKPVSAVFNEQAGCWVLLVWFYLVCYSGMIYGHTQELGMFFAGSSTWIWTKVFTEMFYFFLNGILLKTSTEEQRKKDSRGSESSCWAELWVQQMHSAVVSGIKHPVVTFSV